MARNTHHCGRCGENVTAIKERKGNTLVLFVLLFLFVLPGLVYLVWMLSGRRLMCPKCFSRDVTPIEALTA